LRPILNRSAVREFSTGEQFSGIFTGEQTKKYNNKKNSSNFPYEWPKINLANFYSKIGPMNGPKSKALISLTKSVKRSPGQQLP
jgi:hypothetical protein